MVVVAAAVVVVAAAVAVPAAAAAGRVPEWAPVVRRGSARERALQQVRL